MEDDASDFIKKCRNTISDIEILISFIQGEISRYEGVENKILNSANALAFKGTTEGISGPMSANAAAFLAGSIESGVEAGKLASGESVEQIEKEEGEEVEEEKEKKKKAEKKKVEKKIKEEFGKILTKDEAEKYIKGDFLGTYNSKEISKLPKKITYKDNKSGYTYIYELGALTATFFGVKMNAKDNIIKLKNGEVEDINAYSYKCISSDEPPISYGVVTAGGIGEIGEVEIADEIATLKTTTLPKDIFPEVNVKSVEISDVKSIAELKNVENFKEGSLEHILEGQLNTRGKAVGFHYEGMPTAKGEIIPGTESIPNKFGVYNAKVEVNGVPKTANGGLSSFYPKSWNSQDIVDSINEAYSNKTFVRGNKYIGTLSTGMKIEMFIDSSGKVISAYPKL